ncbi:hypothetical protein [Roseateles sp. MS654]|uniref:hypothetical protein n=1 Tax=Roseateles sp. MS654 TaxID=3412685 RepID=UPI003C2EED35
MKKYPNAVAISDFVTAGIAAAIIAGCFSSFAVSIVIPLVEERSLYITLVSFFIYLPYAALLNLLVGLPVFLLLAWRRLVQWWVWGPLAVTAALAVELMLQGVKGFNIEKLTLYIPVAVVCAAIFRCALKGSVRPATV